MMHWRGVKLLVVLALLSAGGIVAMLLVDGPWDAALLLLAALPLAIGGWRVFALRGEASREARTMAGQRCE